jgi:hypothetical protein
VSGCDITYKRFVMGMRCLLPPTISKHVMIEKCNENFFDHFSVKNVSTFFIKQDVTACGLQINGHDRLFDLILIEVTGGSSGERSRTHSRRQSGDY